jgi:hypothetical protein
MMRRIGVLLVVVMAVVSFLCTAQAQMPQKGWKNVISLPNGDVILDMNGEWDVLIENYGSWKEFGSYPQMIRITQEGSSFKGIRMINDPWAIKGSLAIKGDLARGGFNVYTMSNIGSSNSDGQISEDGNKIVINAAQKTKWTLTRK